MRALVDASYSRVAFDQCGERIGIIADDGFIETITKLIEQERAAVGGAVAHGVAGAITAVDVVVAAILAADDFGEDAATLERVADVGCARVTIVADNGIVQALTGIIVTAVDGAGVVIVAEGEFGIPVRVFFTKDRVCLQGAAVRRRDVVALTGLRDAVVEGAGVAVVAVFNGVGAAADTGTAVGSLGIAVPEEAEVSNDGSLGGHLCIGLAGSQLRVVGLDGLTIRKQRAFNVAVCDDTALGAAFVEAVMSAAAGGGARICGAAVIVIALNGGVLAGTRGVADVLGTEVIVIAASAIEAGSTGLGCVNTADNRIT